MAKEKEKKNGLAALAVMTGAALSIAALERAAKEEGKTIDQVAKERLEKFAEDVSSGRLAGKIVHSANWVKDRVLSGEIRGAAQSALRRASDSIQSGECAKKAVRLGTDFLDGVAEILTIPDRAKGGK